jgi:Fungalysin/Thermolysin Propeptide Motif
MAFDENPEVQVDRDESGRVIQLRHTRHAYSLEEAGLEYASASEIAEQYVREVAGVYGIPLEETETLSDLANGTPAAEPTRLKESEQKVVLDTTVVNYQQTYLGLPVWNSNFTVIVAGDPPAVVSSNSTLHDSVEVAGVSAAEVAGLADFQPTTLREAIGVDDAVGSGFAFNGSRLLVYQYDPAERVDPTAGPPVTPTTPEGDLGAEGAGPGPTGSESDAGTGDGGFGSAGFDPDNPPSSPGAAGFTGDEDTGGGSGPAESTPGSATGGGGPAGGTSGSGTSAALQEAPPTLPLPPVPTPIVPGRHYVVREVLFSLTVGAEGELNWRALVEPSTGAVLYLRALTASATCAVFETDPVSKTGNLLTPGSPAAALDAARTLNLALMNLNPPNGSQALSGTLGRVVDIDPPAIPPPTTTSPFSFTYTAVSNDFTAVNAYYHTDWMYRFIEGLGFNVATYFDGTTFPVPVDHQGKGNAVNASANGNAAGNGMGKFLYGLAQAGQVIGIAADVRVCLHEFGHALLWDHVNSPNFGWCHSAGDTLAAILHDPGSKAPDPNMTFPWITAGTPGLDRRHNRDVAAGWAWGGSRDDRQYGSEQILSTLMFRIYRVTGGDDADINVRRFASRYLAYLIVRAIGTLTVTTTDPRVFVAALQNADDLTTVFEGHAGGAWHKVIRWSFERQGLFQPPGAPVPVTQPGAPPNVDVYIDDGRNGSYEPYLTNIGASPGVWNRTSADGGTTNQDPVAGSPNQLYVRVHNRGTQLAQNVAVKAYQGTPGTPLQWPGDWTPLTTASATGPDLAPGASAVIGPFVWTPTQSGPVSVLASASATGDLSNADTVNGPIANKRLVPNDNNLAQRDLTAVGGGGGGGGDTISLKLASGSTTPGSTDWKPYGGVGVYLDVDTSASGFTVTPKYFTSLGGDSSHWATTGVTSIYDATKTGFRVYVRWSDGSSLTPEQANGFKWHVNWYALHEG